MNTIYLAAAAGVLVLVLVAVMVMKKGKTAPAEPAEEKEQRECGDPMLYELGMNPVSDKPIMYALTTSMLGKTMQWEIGLYLDTSLPQLYPLQDFPNMKPRI